MFCSGPFLLCFFLNVKISTSTHKESRQVQHNKSRFPHTFQHPIQYPINYNNRSNTLAAIARKYLARTAPGAEAQSLPLFLERALRAASTASSTSSAVAAGISPVAHSTTSSHIGFKSDYKTHHFISIIFCINLIASYEDGKRDNLWIPHQKIKQNSTTQQSIFYEFNQMIHANQFCVSKQRAKASKFSKIHRLRATTQYIK